MKDQRSSSLYKEMLHHIAFQTDRLFAKLMLFQWALAVTIALFVSPATWSGEETTIHPHVWAAVILGGGISIFAALLATYRTAQVTTRHLIAVSQILMSMLIIHVSGGRIESHFHVFGSLAFIAFYRDPYVLLTATLLTAADHYVRGAYWPMSVYGEEAVSSWRWLEHGAWVIFEDFFLLISCFQSHKNLREIAQKQSSLEEINKKIEAEIVLKTAEIQAQKEVALIKEKMASLGEMAAGMAHEINNPVAVIKLTSEQLEDVLNDETRDVGMCKEMVHTIQHTATRVGAIIRSLKSFARDGGSDPMVPTPLHLIIDETLLICNEKLRKHKVDVQYEACPVDLFLNCRSVQISQIVVNLIQNSIDAIEHLPEKWIAINYTDTAEEFVLTVTDSGKGIPEHIREKILQPFFTTKEVGKGTGLGLSISKSIMQAHNGELSIDTNCPNTRFVLTFKRENYGKQAA